MIEPSKKVLFTSHTANFSKFNRPFMRWFKDQGYEVHYASAGEEEVFDCDTHFTIPFARSPLKFNNIRAIFQLKKIIDREHYDIIHTHTPMGGLVTRLAAMNARRRGTRVIYTAHGFHFFTGAPLVNWLIYYPVEKWMARRTDTLITINDEDYQCAKKKFKTDVKYVPGMGVDPARFEPRLTKKQRTELRKSFDIKQNDFVMIYPAELSKRKRQLWLIDALADFMSNHSDVHLLLPGSDSLDGKCQALVDKLSLGRQIHFPGYRHDIPQLMMASDLAVSSSSQEGLPVNLLEALMAELPIVATDSRGHIDLIKDGFNGYLVDITDKQKFAVKIANIYNDNIKRDKLALNSIKQLNGYRLADIMPVFTEIYAQNKITEISQLTTRGTPIPKLVYLHSAEKVKQDSHGRLYTDGSYNDKVWQRYLKISTNITFIARKDSVSYNDAELDANYHKIHNNVQTIFVENRHSSPMTMLNFAKRRKNTLTIQENLDSANLLIIRMDCSEGYVAAKYAKKIGLPYSVDVVSCAWDSLWNYSLVGKIIAPIRYLKMRYVVRNAEAVLYVTEKYLQSRYPSNGLTEGCSDVMLSSSDIVPERMFKRKSKIILGTIAPLDVAYKGQDAIIKAIYQLNSSRGTTLYEYQLVGGGVSQRLNALVRQYGLEDQIKFIGQLSHEQVFRWLDSIDIYAQPSKVEGLPRALIEALDRGCPSIGSNLGGIPELLPEQALFNWRDTSSIVKTILYISSPDNAKKASAQNLSTAERYKPAILAERRNNFYKLLVRNVSAKRGAK